MKKKKKELLVFSPDPQKQKGPKTDALKKKKNPYTAPLTDCIPRDKIKHLKRAQIKSFHVTF